MSPVKPGLHIKYTVKLSDRVTLLSADGRPSEGLSEASRPVPKGIPLSRPVPAVQVEVVEPAVKVVWSEVIS
jgi:hypothetical protein